MVKSVLSVYRQGLREWIIQRVTAVIIAIYSITLISYLFFHTDLSYAEWRTVFTYGWVKIATVIFLLALLYHAWIGVWTIFTDYVKPFVLRALLNCLVLLMLAVTFLWGVQILWSV